MRTEEELKRKLLNARSRKSNALKRGSELDYKVACTLESFILWTLEKDPLEHLGRGKRIKETMN